jgi:hypothetical protein
MARRMRLSGLGVFRESGAATMLVKQARRARGLFAMVSAAGQCAAGGTGR